MFVLILVYTLSAGVAIAPVQIYQTEDSCNVAGNKWKQEQTAAMRIREWSCLPTDQK